MTDETRSAATGREITLAREAAEEGLREYAEALRYWNAPDDEHTRLQLRSLVEDVIDGSLESEGKALRGEETLSGETPTSGSEESYERDRDLEHRIGDRG